MHFLSRYLQLSFEMSHSKINLLTERLRHPQTRNFVPAPKPAPRPPRALLSGSSDAQPKQRKRPAPKRGSRKRKADVGSPPATKKKQKTKSQDKGKGKARAQDSDDEVIAISSDEEDDNEIQVIDEPTTSGPVRRSSRKRGSAPTSYIEVDEDDEDEVQVLTNDPTTSTLGGPSGADTNQNIDEPVFDGAGLIAMGDAETHEHDMTIIIKSEDQPEEPFLHASTPPATIRRSPDMPPSPGDSTPTPPPHIDLGSDEDEDQKPKPILKLTYEGFTTNDKCLCVIVEPYPPLPAVRRQVSLAPMGVRGPRAPSIAPADFVPSGGAAQRARTPLFLPDEEDERGFTPAPSSRRVLPPVPLFLEDPDENEDDDELGGGMFALSQVLRTVGNNTSILAEDEDEIDGAIFFGDADEAREL